MGYHDLVVAYKRRVLADALRESRGSRSVAAERLGLPRTYFQRLILTLKVPCAPALGGSLGQKLAASVRAGR